MVRRERLTVNANDFDSIVIDMLAEIESLRAKLAEAEKDAKRYRWLRDTQSELFGDEYGFTFVYECKFDDFKQPRRGLDSAIDAAMEEHKDET